MTEYQEMLRRLLRGEIRNKLEDVVFEVEFPPEIKYPLVGCVCQGEDTPIYILFSEEEKRAYVGEIDEDFVVRNVRVLPGGEGFSHPHALWDLRSENWLLTMINAPERRLKLSRLSPDLEREVASTYPLTVAGVEVVVGGFVSLFYTYELRDMAPTFTGKDPVWLIGDVHVPGVQPLTGVGLLVADNIAETLPTFGTHRGKLFPEAASYSIHAGEYGKGFTIDGASSPFQFGSHVAFIANTHHRGSKLPIPCWMLWDNQAGRWVGGYSPQPLVEIPPSMYFIAVHNFTLTSLLGRRLHLFLPYLLDGAVRAVALPISPRAFPPEGYRQVIWSLWLDDAISAGENSPAIPGHGRKTVHFTSDTSGDLTAYLDAVGRNDWKTVFTLTGVTSALEQTLHSGMRFRLGFSVAATVTANVVVEPT